MLNLDEELAIVTGEARSEYPPGSDIAEFSTNFASLESVLYPAIPDCGRS